MRLIFIAPPGAGKGTQAAFVSEKYGIPSISSGNIVRAAIEEGTEIGKIAEKYIHEGNFIPDDIVIKMIEKEVTKPECVEKGFILDGFPRTLFQALCLDNKLKELKLCLDRILILYVPKTDLIKRLASRRSCYHCGATFHMKFRPPKVEGICDKCGSELHRREDDTPSSIKTRIRLYTHETIPIIDYYSRTGKVRRINGKGEVSEIFDSITEVLENIK